ncbi:hypothetical protein HPB51_025396 [Rhipicephalus microplus]|uniref:Craniofacial development protein 1 n=1 Tax=Rhipicephalus microplus TaxID=6941 RepID=A0A9J6DDG4_RHIMP|nr:hypothetical protein HPB51_025396 [Rhipicephalus microplus]
MMSRTSGEAPPIQHRRAADSQATTLCFSVRRLKGLEVAHFKFIFRVDKEVAADSKEARLFVQQKETPQAKSPVLPGKRKPIGVGNVLNQLFNKKQKISTLEKSKLDWDNYKKSEGLVEDLQSHNRGKDGYLEKQAFLQRADVRQFEIEKTLRAKNRSSHHL